MTNTACPLRIIKCVALEAREYTEPGTAIGGRPQPNAQLAVLRAPDRNTQRYLSVARSHLRPLRGFAVSKKGEQDLRQTEGVWIP